jgi:hypothetical protein
VHILHRSLSLVHVLCTGLSLVHVLGNSGERKSGCNLDQEFPRRRVQNLEWVITVFQGRTSFTDLHTCFLAINLLKIVESPTPRMEEMTSWWAGALDYPTESDSVQGKQELKLSLEKLPIQRLALGEGFIRRPESSCVQEKRFTADTSRLPLASLRGSSSPHPTAQQLT